MQKSVNLAVGCWLPPTTIVCTIYTSLSATQLLQQTLAAETFVQRMFDRLWTAYKTQ